MKRNGGNIGSGNLFKINNQSENRLKTDISAERLNQEKTELSDWQMHQLAISSVAFTITVEMDSYPGITINRNDFTYFFSNYTLGKPSSNLCLKNTYTDSYKVIFDGNKTFSPCVMAFLYDNNNQFIERSSYEKNAFMRDFLHKIRMGAKHLHRVSQIMINYDVYFFTQGPSSLSLHFEALETECTQNTIVRDFYADGLDDHIDKKRIASRYQTLSFYDYDYFYKDEAPDETAVDFWLAMDRFLEEPYFTQQNLYGENSGLSRDEKEQKRQENANKKDKLRNYVHRIMIVPDELLNDNEKNFRQWVRNSENQKKFIKIYQNTFNRVPETGLNKIENPKENIGSKLLFCKQEMTVTNPDGKKETKSVYSLKLLENGKWVEYPKNKYERYSKVDVYDSGHVVRDIKTLEYELNDKEELYEFPNMEYLTYLLHADPKKLSKIEKEFVDAFLHRSANGAFSLGVKMRTENVKQYVHDNLITKRENWKLKENGLSDQDIDVLNILNDDDRINEFNKSVEEIYNADLVKNLWDTSQEELKAKDGINNFDAPTDEPEQYDIAKAMYKTLQICNEKEIKEKNILPEKVIINTSDSIEKGNEQEESKAKDKLLKKVITGKSKIIEKNSRDESYQITKNKSIITFDWSRFLKFLAVALLVSLVIFIALKFIFDVVALWALIVFPVAPVIIFFVCVFFLRNKFKETTCLHKIEVPIHDNENQLNLQIDERNDRTANEPELVNQENNTFKKDDK